MGRIINYAGKKGRQQRKVRKGGEGGGINRKGGHRQSPRRCLIRVLGEERCLVGIRLVQIFQNEVRFDQRFLRAVLLEAGEGRNQAAGVGLGETWACWLSTEQCKALQSNGATTDIPRLFAASVDFDLFVRDILLLEGDPCPLDEGAEPAYLVSHKDFTMESLSRPISIGGLGKNHLEIYAIPGDSKIGVESNPGTRKMPVPVVKPETPLNVRESSHLSRS